MADAHGLGTDARYPRRWLIGGGATLTLAGLSVLALSLGVRKVVVIAWVAYLAMAVGTWLGGRVRETNAHRLVWGYGLASGAMIMSAAMFLVPQAIGLGSGAAEPRLGGVGLAAGIVVGYSGHTIGHRLTHLDLPFDVSTAEISAHALSAGLVIGVVYATMPGLGILLGLAIVSHKGPAGYAAARRLVRAEKSPTVLLLPAAGVGLTAIPMALVPVPQSPVFNAVVFGFAAGVFLHVAMDFLPNCEAGSEIDEVVSGDVASHHLLDQLRTHAVASTVVGAVVVVAAWLAV
jgi:ZIP family zinc transporter